MPDEQMVYPPDGLLENMNAYADRNLPTALNHLQDVKETLIALQDWCRFLDRRRRRSSDKASKAEKVFEILEAMKTLKYSTASLKAQLRNIFERGLWDEADAILGFVDGLLNEYEFAEEKSHGT